MLPTDKDLKSVAGDVAYEVNMLCYCFKKLRRSQPTVTVPDVDDNVCCDTTSSTAVYHHHLTEITLKDTVELNTKRVYLESFLIHARNLRDFFWPETKKVRRDDILASHYIPKWDEVKPLIDKYLEDTKVRLDKSIAHLTYSRASYKDEVWETRTMFNALIGAWNVFYDNLPDDKKKWFKISLDIPLLSSIYYVPTKIRE